MEQYFHVECDCAGSGCGKGVNLGTEEIALLRLAIPARYPRPINGIFGAIKVIN
jgi:hypothetical protein